MPTPPKCVYCGRLATTRDHVIPRCLLEKPYPSNLPPRLPSCRPCNEAFSLDEQYFFTVMAQSGFVPSLQRKVEKGGVVDRTLERSPGLDADFAKHMNVAEDGRVFIVPDETRIANVTRKIAFGLYCSRYTPATIPALEDFLPLKPFHALDNTNFIVVMAHTEKFKPRRWNHVQTIRLPERGNVQVFDYMFVRNWVYTDFGRLFCIMRFHETIWAGVRCPQPSTRRNVKHRIGTPYAGHQEEFSF